ncbi:MAG: 5'/3'-nucleotidase SurE [Saccharofermentans sp.]|nr:5'/3'-nucleotidase SurE [Saccharofermentans sp.]
MRKILIANDDGINSEGLAMLAAAAKKFGEVWVVAPDSQRSAMSHYSTFWRGVDVWPSDFPVDGVHAYVCSGTPADCIRLGVIAVVPGGPDNVFCGINLGYNIASDIQYSATVGAAFEAAALKKHTIAFSKEYDGVNDVTEKYIEEIAARLLDEPLGHNEVWNVNFPGCPLSECKGVLYDCKLSEDDFDIIGYNVTAKDGDKITYQVDYNRTWEGSPGTDLYAVVNKYVSVGKVKNIS